MNNQFKKITLEAEEGMMFEITKTSEGVLVRVINILSKAEYIGDYTKPPIPEGYSYVEGKWNTGFVIQDQFGNQFVWIPVGVLPSNGTLDGKHFTEKFGRRNYRNDEFSRSKFHEDMDETLEKQLKSVQKYGGFYISRYTISKSKNDKPASVKGAMPWTNIDFPDAIKESKKLGQGIVQSHLWYGAECDSVLEWLKTTVKSHNEIAEDSTNCGNYWNSDKSPQKVVKTGSRDEWYANNIADIFGNTWEWTQEANKSSFRVLRCGSYYYSGYDSLVAYRNLSRISNYSNSIGFRGALYIE